MRNAKYDGCQMFLTKIRSGCSFCWKLASAANGVNMTKISRTIKAGVICSIIGCLAFSNAARSEPAACGDRDELIETLKKKYKEVPVALGISQKSTEAFEIFASEKGTWTVVMTTSTGLTCVMATGHSWREIPRVALGPVT